MNNSYSFHFISMILIFVISTINAFYIISMDECSLFIKFLSLFLIFLIIYMSSFKETFLNFLGNCAYPISLIPNANYPPNTNFSIDLDLKAPNGTKVIYWAAENNKDKKYIFENPVDAYGKYENSGVAIVNNNKVVISIKCPNKYKIPSGSTLNQHIHYRIAYPNNPILSDVKTLKINC